MWKPRTRKVSRILTVVTNKPIQTSRNTSQVFRNRSQRGGTYHISLYISAPQFMLRFTISNRWLFPDGRRHREGRVRLLARRRGRLRAPSRNKHLSLARNFPRIPQIKRSRGTAAGCCWPRECQGLLRPLGQKLGLPWVATWLSNAKVRKQEERKKDSSFFTRPPPSSSQEVVQRQRSCASYPNL